MLLEPWGEAGCPPSPQEPWVAREASTAHLAATAVMTVCPRSRGGHPGLGKIPHGCGGWRGLGEQQGSSSRGDFEPRVWGVIQSLGNIQLSAGTLGLLKDEGGRAKMVA